MTASTRWYGAEQLRRISEVTIAHYDRLAEAYWHGTRDHDLNRDPECRPNRLRPTDRNARSSPLKSAAAACIVPSGGCGHGSADIPQMTATPTIVLVEQGWQGGRGEGQTGRRLDRPSRAFIRAMQSVKRNQDGMSDRIEDGCLCG